jgi:hypothetical protein
VVFWNACQADDVAVHVYSLSGFADRLPEVHKVSCPVSLRSKNATRRTILGPYIVNDMSLRMRESQFRLMKM